jgi:hypothetical protein
VSERAIALELHIMHLAIAPAMVCMCIAAANINRDRFAWTAAAVNMTS